MLSILEYLEKSYTVAQVAGNLQVKDDTVLELISSGVLKATNINPNGQRPRWRISAHDYGQFLMENRTKEPKAEPEKTPRKRRSARKTKSHFGEMD